MLQRFMWPSRLCYMSTLASAVMAMLGVDDACTLLCALHPGVALMFMLNVHNPTSARGYCGGTTMSSFGRRACPEWRLVAIYLVNPAEEENMVTKPWHDCDMKVALCASPFSPVIVPGGTGGRPKEYPLAS